jgi:preprotein translocase subunit SecG
VSEADEALVVMLLVVVLLVVVVLAHRLPRGGQEGL